MAFGKVKVDQIIYSSGASEVTLNVSGLLDASASNLTISGTISGVTGEFQTVVAPSGNFSGLAVSTGDFTYITGVEVNVLTLLSGTTITGQTGNFDVLNVGGHTSTGTISGTTITGQTGNFDVLNANTATFVTGITKERLTVTGDAYFVEDIFVTGSGVFGSGVYSTGGVISGITVQGGTGDFTNITGANIYGTTLISGQTISGVDIRGTTSISGNLITGGNLTVTGTISGSVITGDTGRFTSITGTNIIGVTSISGGDISGNSLVATSVTGGSLLVTGNVTHTGNATTDLKGYPLEVGSGTRELRFYEANNTNYVALKAASGVSSNVTWTLPDADATVSGYALVSDAAGTLSWASAGDEQVYSTGINSTALPGEGTVYVVLKGNSVGSGVAYSTGSLYYTAASNYLNAVGLSGTTITGDTGNIGTGNFVLAKGTTISGTTITGQTGNFNIATIGTNLNSNGGSTLKKTTTITGFLGLLQFKDNSDSDTTEVRFYQGNSANYVAFRAPTTLDGSNTTFRLPSGDSTSGDVLTTDGAGKLSFTTISAGSTLSGRTLTGITQYGANQDTLTQSGAVVIGTAAGKIANAFGRTTIFSGVLIGQNVCSGTTGFASNEGKNVIIGCEAATNLYEPQRSVIIGFEGGKGGTNTYRASDDCVLIGYQAGKDANIFGYATSTEKAIVIGSKACNLHAGIGNGIYIGTEACSGFITSHSNNTVIGHRALRRAGTASSNVLIGSYVAISGEYYTNTVAIGYECASQNASSESENSGNVFIGYQCAKHLTLGIQQNSVVIGEKAATTGFNVQDSVVIGKDACGVANVVSGVIAIGYKAGGKPNAVGTQNVFIGNQTASGHQTGQYNTYVGHGIASGAFASFNQKNSVMGYGAVPFLFEASGNVILGHQAAVTTRYASGCTYIGANCVAFSFSGTGNTVVGNLAGNDLDYGAYNTLIGTEADGIGTGSNNTVIGYQAAASSLLVSNQITLGNSSITSLRCNVTSISSLSDERDKTNITDLDHGVNFIKRLRPVKFDWARRDGSFEGKKDYGFIAQELQAIETELNTIEYTNLVDDSNPEKLEAAPFKTYPILVQAVKELINRLEIAEQAIVQLQGT
jgi:hypothetical protein